MMKLRIAVGCVGLILSIGLFAQVDDSKAPVSEEYQHYLDHKEEYTAGYIPSPLKLTFSDVSVKGMQIYPEVYDLRDVDGVSYLTPVRNQGSYGTCWAFAANASLESYWLKSLGISLDLSERNMVHCHGFEWGPNVGGNSSLASAYLTRLSGPYLDTQDPYSNMGINGCVDLGDSIQPQAFVTEYLLTGGEETVKYMIYKYGAVATSMSTDNFYSHYNSSDNTFYYGGTKGVDHGVTIVGWNDTLKVTGLALGNPPSKGAWIIKNSWGTSFGDEGYFYVSYHDMHVGEKVSIYPERVEINEVDTLYMNDFLGAVGSHGFPEAEDKETAYALAKFDANSAQLINRLGTNVNTGGSTLDFVVSREWDGINLIDTIGELKSQVCRFPGYHSYPVSFQVDSGSFYVQIKYHTPGNNYPITVEEYEDGFAIPVLEASGKQWVSSNGTDWDAVGSDAEFKKDLCVRAYGKKLKTITASFDTDRGIYCLGMPTKLINQSIGVADSFKWELKDGMMDTSIVIYSSDDTLSFEFASEGLKNIHLIAYAGVYSDSLFRSQYVDVVLEPEVYLSLNGDRSTVAIGKPVTLTVFGAEDYLWEIEHIGNGATNNVMSFIPMHAEQWVKVNGYLGACSGRDSILIKAVEVKYDDIADAKLLDLNAKFGPFSNKYATVESNEPAPVEGDCDTQTTWCVEGGLHNSIWFKFIAPISGEVNIVSNGFDNQMAVYAAKASGSWEDILSGDEGKYELLAANDDAHEEDYSAEIDRLSGLTPGNTYWIQIDGSAGGDEGQMYIEVNATIPTLEKFPIVVSPNPFSELMTVDLRGLNMEETNVKIYSMLGKCIYNENISDYYFTIDKAITASGTYILEITSEKKRFKTIFSCVD